MTRRVVVSNPLRAGNYLTLKWRGDVLQQHGKTWCKVDQKAARHEVQLFLFIRQREPWGRHLGVPT